MELFKEIWAEYGKFVAAAITAGTTFGGTFALLNTIFNDNFFALQGATLMLIVSFSAIGAVTIWRKRRKSGQSADSSANSEASGVPGRAASDGAADSQLVPTPKPSKFVGGIYSFLALSTLGMFVYLLGNKLKEQQLWPFEPEKTYWIYVSDFLKMGDDSQIDPVRMTSIIVDRMKRGLKEYDEGDVNVEPDSIGKIVRSPHNARQRLEQLDKGECLIWGNVTSERQRNYLETNIEFEDFDYQIPSEKDTIALDSIEIKLRQDLGSRLNCTVFLGIGILKYQRKDYEGAVSILKDALAACGEEAALENLPFAYYFMTASYVKQSKLDLAKFWWAKLKSLEIAENKLGDAFGAYDRYLGFTNQAGIDTSGSNGKPGLPHKFSSKSLDDWKSSRIDSSITRAQIAPKGSPQNTDSVFSQYIKIISRTSNSQKGTKQQLFGIGRVREWKIDLQLVRRELDTLVTPQYLRLMELRDGRFLATSSDIAVTPDGECNLKYIINQNGAIVSDSYCDIRVYRTDIPIGAYLGAKRLTPNYYNRWATNYLGLFPGKEGVLFNENGQKILTMEIDSIADTDIGGVYITRFHHKYGWIYPEGIFVADCKYDSKPSFAGGVSLIRMNGKFGYVNRVGASLISFNYKSLRRYSNALIPAENMSNSWGAIDSQERQVIPFKYRMIKEVQEGFVEVQEKNGAWGFFDLKGKRVTSFSFEKTLPFSNGLAGVQVNGQWGFINSTGFSVIRPQFERVFQNFQTNGLAAVSKEGHSFYIDRHGNCVDQENYPCPPIR